MVKELNKEFKETDSDYVPRDPEEDDEISSDGEFLAEQYKFEEDDPKAALYEQEIYGFCFNKEGLQVDQNKTVYMNEENESDF